MTEAERESLAAAKREEEELSLPLMAAAALDVDDDDRSSCLLRMSLIRFRSAEVTFDLDLTPPRSLYIIIVGLAVVEAERHRFEEQFPLAVEKAS